MFLHYVGPLIFYAPMIEKCLKRNIIISQVRKILFVVNVCKNDTEKRFCNV